MGRIHRLPSEITPKNVVAMVQKAAVAEGGEVDVVLEGQAQPPRVNYATDIPWRREEMQNEIRKTNLAC
jgi:hypothetical protein